MIVDENLGEINYHIRENNFTILQGNNPLGFLNRIITNTIQNNSDRNLNLTLLCGASGRIEDFLEVIFSDGKLIVMGINTNGDNNRQKLVQGKNWNEKINIMDGDEALTFLTIFGEEVNDIANSFNLEKSLDESKAWIESESKLICYNNTNPPSIDLIIQTDSLSFFLESGIESALKKSSINTWNKFCIDNSILQCDDLMSSPLPFECGLGHLIDSNKGCYPGQEIHARIESRGKHTKFIAKFVANSHLHTGKYRSEDGKKIMITTISIIGDKSYGFAILPTHFQDNNEISIIDKKPTTLYLESF